GAELLSSTDDDSRDSGPGTGIGCITAVEEEPHAGDIGGSKLAVLEMIGLQDGEVRLVSKRIRLEAEHAKLLVAVERIVNPHLRAARCERVHRGEHPRERRFLDSAPIRRTQHY